MFNKKQIADGISQRLEKEGVRRGLLKVIEEASKYNLTVKSVVTDESASVGVRHFKTYHRELCKQTKAKTEAACLVTDKEFAQIVETS